MSAKHWAFYRLDTGLFTGRSVMCFEREIAGNTPEGCAVIEGQYDRHVQRVDLSTLQVVAYERPAAEIDAEQRVARGRHARQRIDDLERQQARPMRELAIDPNNAAARTRLTAIDEEIEALRPDLLGRG